MSTLPVVVTARNASGLTTTANAVININDVAPVSLFTTQTPTQPNETDGAGSAGDYELGMRFSASVNGQITGIRYWRAASETGTHTGRIWSNTGTQLASVVFTNDTGSGWKTQALATPLNITAGTQYVVSVNTVVRYAATTSGFSSAISNGGLTAPVGAGIFNGTPGSFPTASYSNTNYFRDVVFIPGAAPPLQAPVVSNGSFSLVVPASAGPVGTMSATNNPTSWAITAGNAAGYFSINSSGVISTTAAVVAGSYSLTVSATNAAGSGSGTVSINAAASTGWPNASNTGVQAGVTLTNYTGPMIISTPGALIENKIISGTLTVTATNVTIRNCRIQNFGLWGVLCDNATNTRVEYCDIDGTGSTRTSGLGIGSGTTSAVLNCDIRGMVVGIQLFGRCEVRENYIHDLVDTSSNPDDRHFDGITCFGGQNGSVIDHNYIAIPPGTAAVFIKTQFGAINGITVNNNYLSGGSYTCYCENTGAGIQNVSFTNNTIGRGQYGYWNIANSTPVRTGNKDAITGANIDNA
jgi:hypothetical protein